MNASDADQFYSEWTSDDGLLRKIIGRTVNGRPIIVSFLGNPLSSVRIFIIAGQHGDESTATKGTEKFLNEFIGEDVSNVHIAVLCDANPDGSSMNIRNNAEGVDLNRDHLILRAPETFAIHMFVRMFSPHIIVDIHAYPFRRKYLSDNQLVHCTDLFFDIPTHPNIERNWSGTGPADLMDFLLTELNGQRYICDRYILSSRKNNIRHSTPDIVDARNGLSLRYGILTLLVEVRKSRKKDVDYLTGAVQSSILSILEWTKNNSHIFSEWPFDFGDVSSIIVRSSYTKKISSPFYRFMDKKSKELKIRTPPGSYIGGVKVRMEVNPPDAYAVPVNLNKVNTLLKKHGFISVYGKDYPYSHCEEAHIESVEWSTRINRYPRKLSIFIKKRDAVDLSSYAVYEVSKKSVLPLSVYLEPCSKYGISRFSEFEMRFTPQSIYPILRIFRNSRSPNE